MYGIAPKYRIIGLTVTTALALVQTQAFAQSDNAPQITDEIIVIGTAGGKGINRLDASFAVTTFNPDELELISPKSTADLLKSVPGIWAESSGGVAGANIDVRGLPGGGDAPFVSFSVNGSPLYGTNTLSFFEGSTLFRIDETVAGVEAIRGGPNAVFAKGEPGATINFSLLKGGEDTAGRVKYTTSDYDLQRFDGVLSGKLADDLYYMVGGFVQSSPGIRDAEFTSEEGYQISGQLTKVFERGEVNVYTRITDDAGQWYLPVNLANNEIDQGTFSQLGNATRLREIQVNSNGDTEVFDFANGRGWDGTVSGANVEFDLGGGFTLRDNVNYVKGNADTYGFVPSGSAVRVSALDATAIAGGVPISSTGTTLAQDDFAQTYGHWIVQKDLESFSNDLSISKTLGGSHDVTVGLYTASFGSDDTWYLGNPIAVHNAANGGILTNVTPQDIANAGGDAGFSFGLQSAGDARIMAFYAADSWQVTDRLRIDVGARQENIKIDYVLDTGPGYADGTTDLSTTIEDDQFAYTAAVNFDVSDDLSVFARYSDGFSFPNFDRIREGQPQVNDVEQLEGGLKLRSNLYELYGTVFYNTNDSFASTVGGTVPNAAFTTEAIGLELDGSLNLGGFGLRAVATLQDASIDTSTTAANEGNTVLRQPDFQVRLAPSYTFQTSIADVIFYGAFSHVGERFGDNANTVILPSYEKVDLGAIVRTDSGLFFQVAGDNIFDSNGITEGDPRNPTAPNGRPILGASVKFSVGYDF